MEEKKLIIFDLDGVLVDSHQIVSNSLLETFPTFTNELLREILTGNFHDEMEKAKLIHKAKKETEKEKEIRQADYVEKKSQVPLFPGILNLLEKLHKEGYTLIVNTSALEKNCLPLLKKLDILKLFDFIATAELSKSKVEKFRAIEEKYHTSNNKVLFITDTLGDVREAKVVGVPTVAVTWGGAHDRSHFTREINDNLVAIVDSVGELEEVIMKR